MFALGNGEIRVRVEETGRSVGCVFTLGNSGTDQSEGGGDGDARRAR